MNPIAENIKLRMSLREPLQASLDVLAQLTDALSLRKVPAETEEAEAFLAQELATVKGIVPTCKDFERQFPSVAYSIATGVGKTRLMGAAVAYLYLRKGIRNFFVLAPNLTIYEKLIRDFGDTAYTKYLFQGITEFVHNPPKIVTGDNYAQQSNLFSATDIRINIFNISKFNAENKGTKKDGVPQGPKIKRLSEYLGQSYWDYLSGLDDLVILMDEAHRYHADASKNAINELRPVLGLELTATPFDEKERPFRNIVYEYSLARALEEGRYVKNPTIATRKNFERGSLSDRELDVIKLENALSIHEETKIDLEIYAKDNNTKLVKPFVLVVCKDISHARETLELVSSDAFYEGRYKGKAIQIDSSTKKEEDIERQFVSLESPDNPVEIVIHVNMLKEGWDVSNLYTIVPLRAANAAVLIEQTIGRGLRLPYDGRRTGVPNIDKLTVIAHENFNAILEAAQNPQSPLNKLNYVEMEAFEIPFKQVTVSSKPIMEQKLEKEQENVNEIKDEKTKQKAQNGLDAKKIILQELPSLGAVSGVNNVNDLQKPEIKNRAMKAVEQKLNLENNMFKAEILQEAEVLYERLVKDYKKNIIEIPRIDLEEIQAEARFSHFELDTSDFHFNVLGQEIIRVGLKDRKIETIKAVSSGSYGHPVKLIIAELLDQPEVDYDDNADLLNSLAESAFRAISEKLETPKEALEVVFQYKKRIAELIYIQMKAHFEVYMPESDRVTVLPFSKIEQWNYSAAAEAKTRDYRESVSPISTIPKLIFAGFEKACHFEYKFDSKAELELAFVLENDQLVQKWMRPALNQFRIYWDNNTKKYEPDFVVETEERIYLVEVKASNEISNADVQAKKKQAERYCRKASEFTARNHGKPWSYVILPHDEISKTVSFKFLTEKHLPK